MTRIREAESLYKVDHLDDGGSVTSSLALTLKEFIQIVSKDFACSPTRVGVVNRTWWQKVDEMQGWRVLGGRNILGNLKPGHPPDAVLVSQAPLSTHHALKVKAIAKVSSCFDCSGI